MPDQHYVRSSSDGWLRVKREPGGVIIALPEYLKVELTSSSGGRDYFTALEGPERNNRFSVIAGNLRKGNPGYRAAAMLRFSLSQEKLTYAGVTVPAITSERRPIPIGTHPIQIPDFPHMLGMRYIGETPYTKSWFYLGIGHAVPGSNDWYLHTGEASDGCITVEPTGWTALYRHLILSRSGNDKTVGNVIVVR